MNLCIMVKKKSYSEEKLNEMIVPITRAIADQARTIRIPVHMVETINRMRQATNQLVYQNGHEPTPEELAKAMDMSVERVREIQRMAQEPASLESPVGEEEDSSLGDFVADENAEAPGKAADRAMVAQQINQALKSLTPREEKVIRLRFGLDDGLYSRYGMKVVWMGFARS